MRGDTARLAGMAWFTGLQLGSIVLFPHFAYYEKAPNLDPSSFSRDLDKASSYKNNENLKRKQSMSRASPANTS